MKMFDLSGRVAVVTGGNGGIGLGLAQGLAEAGATIVIAARNAEKNAAACAAIAEAGGKAIAVPTDIRNAEQCRAVVDRAVAECGRVDILVNNSGINYRKQAHEFTLEDWHDVIDTNLTAAFVLSQAVYPHYVKQGGGKIINIASIAAVMANPFGVAYSPSKGGIVQMSRALAVAWGKDNVQSNAILPGWIDTPMSVRTRATLPELHNTVIARTPAGRWGVPEDFAGAAVYLASAASNYVNGAVLVIDGGYSVKI
jgi:2-deoxy-D-gluconate 3-dehydrogenase